MDFVIDVIFPPFWILKLAIYVLLNIILVLILKKVKISELFIGAKPITPLLMLFCNYIYDRSFWGFPGMASSNPIIVFFVNFLKLDPLYISGSSAEHFAKLYLLFSISSLAINFLIYIIYCIKNGFSNVKTGLKPMMVINTIFDIILVFLVIDGINNPFQFSLRY